MERAPALFIDGGTTFSERDDYLQYLRDREVGLEKEGNWSKRECTLKICWIGK